MLSHVCVFSMGIQLEQINVRSHKRLVLTASFNWMAPIINVLRPQQHISELITKTTLRVISFPCQNAP